jgi:hypothetical protein
VAIPARRDKDRWHQLADLIQDSNLPASDKSVFRYLLDRSNYGTGELAARFAPLQATIGRKTSHSPRQVRYATRHLERHGWLAASRNTQEDSPDRRRLRYELAFGGECDCVGRVHDPTTGSGNRKHR